MRSWASIAGLCGLLAAPACGHAPTGWYPGAMIVTTVQIARDINELNTRNEEEKRAAELAEAEARRIRENEAARRRALEQEIAANGGPPPSSAATPGRELEVKRALVRAQVGAAAPAQGFARVVVALTKEPEGRSADEIAALAEEAAGYLQTALAASRLRRTDDVRWRDETRATFCLIGELPRTPGVDDALVRGCKPARPAMSGDQVPGFVAECRERAGGDARRLAWDSLQYDLKLAAATSDRWHCT